MGLRNKIITGIGALTFSALSLLGCGQDYTKTPLAKEAEEIKNYFAMICNHHLGGIAMTNGDFDGDGDLDLIVGASNGKLYFFENDGQGNFKLKPQSIIYPENY